METISMFPIHLQFYLATPIENVSMDTIRGLMPDLPVGGEDDLLKHSDAWPEAVVLVKDRRGYEPGERCDFPVEIDFIHFPGRVPGNQSVMLPTKLALLRTLASTFECRTICDASGFFIEEEGSIQAYAWTECFLCQGGRVFGGAVPVYEARDGSRPADSWIPLDDLPEPSLTRTGSLADPDQAIEQVAEWTASRNTEHLRATGHPIPPKQPEVPQTPPTPEEIEAEIAEEFPTEEELDREEEEWTAYTERLEAWEKGGGTTSSKQLIAGGTALPSPDSLDEAALGKKLWEVIHALRDRNTYLHHTDHLSDRELYTWLWEEGLNDTIMDLSGLSDCGFHTSPIGSGDEESTEISLIYYDDAERRAEWKASYPDSTIPAHIDPPHDRDRHLPKRDYRPD